MPTPDGDVATRAVCEAAGVTQPVLYRLFGDKRGLLDALAETGLQRYAARKAELEASDDPSADLRRGWDDHLAFAREHAALYRLMFAPRPWASSAARDGVTAGGRDLRDGGSGCGRPAGVVHDDREAVCCQPDRDRTADAAGAARHDGDALGCGAHQVPFIVTSSLFRRYDGT